MRYSSEKPFPITYVDPQQRRHNALVSAVERATSKDDRTLGVLFVGGSSPFDVQVRMAQSHLRLDRLPSYWSHTALVLDWPDKADPAQVVCAEVALGKGEDADFVPERNGVTLTPLEKYMDRERYPNLAFATLCLPREPKTQRKGLQAEVSDPVVSAETKNQLLAAALEPSRERSRYPLWEMTGVWSRYLTTSLENPLLEDVAHPSSAFCEYVYGASGFDLTPGATAPNVCPEVLWSTLRYWSERFARTEHGLAAWSSVERDDSPTRAPLSVSLKSDFAKALRDNAKSRTSKKRRTRSKRK